VIMLVIGVATGISIVPQQHRLFAAETEAPTVALGLNGSAIYAGAALGSGLGGLVVATLGAGWLPLAAGLTGVAALALIWLTAPER
jgi:MFS transporter, DHA1 family, inner membrane transport protein